MAGPLGVDDLVLCSGTIRRAPLDVTVRAAAAAGFRGVSIYYDEYVAARTHGWSDADLRALLDEHDVAVAEIDGRMDWLPGDADAPTVAEFVSAAAAVRARSVTVLEFLGRPVGDDAHNGFPDDGISFDVAATAFAAVCDRAADHDLLAHIEYFPFSGIRDLRTAYEVARRAGRPNGGVMIDCWHHARGPDAGRVDLGIPGSAVLAVQVGDVAATPGADPADEMMHGRVLPGDGAGNLARLVRGLRDQGCVAPMEVEVYSDELAARDPFDAARRAGDALRAVLVAAGIT